MNLRGIHVILKSVIQWSVLPVHYFLQSQDYCVLQIWLMYEDFYKEYRR